ncbi:hypothetical protein COY28_03575, partial [Candidatus Woesearchaeota archaeon CG_4_10_14_0_2_um_filter_57_5]
MMDIAIIVSVQDPAGMNVRERLLARMPWHAQGAHDGSALLHAQTPLHRLLLLTAQKDTIHCEDLGSTMRALGFAADMFLFLTRHASRAGVPTMSCHAPGNWGDALQGGKKRALGIAPALWQRRAYLALVRHCPDGYDPVMEATHHGPLLDRPCLFMEIGSTGKEWVDPVAGAALASAVVQLLSIDPMSKDAEVPRIVVGLGGTHTCAEFNKAVQRYPMAVGHVCPKYALPDLDEDMLRQAIGRTMAGVDLDTGTMGVDAILLDWKGLGQEKARVMALAEEFAASHGLQVLRTDKLSTDVAPARTEESQPAPADASYYSSIASGYDDLHGDEQRAKYALVLPHIAQYSSLLDVGCGTGMLHDAWHQNIDSNGPLEVSSISKRTYCGLDPSVGLIEQGVRAGRKGLQVGSAEALPFADDSFDVVVSFTALHHCADVETAVAEMARVARTRIVISSLRR